MGRPPCCDKSNVKRGLWTAEEDAKILAYVSNHGVGNWTLVPKRAGLNRCGKSCRLRWTNYLRPDLKHDSFTPQEEQLIIELHQAIGSRWSFIAKRLPGRTDNDVKNYWNTKLKKKLTKMGIDPVTHKPVSQVLSDYGNISTRGNSNIPTGPFFRNFNIRPESSNTVLNWVSTQNFVSSNVKETNIPTVGFLNDVTSSCSSSSSSAKLAPQAVTPACCFNWSEFLLTDPFQEQEPYELQGVLSSASSSSTLTRDEMRNESEVGGVVTDWKNSNSDLAAASASSFVDGILDRDSEMMSQFPQLLDGSLDY